MEFGHNQSNQIVFAWRRPTPPLFIGGAEISRALLAEDLADAGWQVMYLGSYEHPRGDPPHGAEARDQAVATLTERGVRVALDGAVITYGFRGIVCISLPQIQLNHRLAGLLDAPPHRIFLAQEGSASLARHARKQDIPIVGILHSVSRTGVEILAARPAYALVPSKYVLTHCRPDPITSCVLMYPTFRLPLDAIPFSASREDLLLVNPVPGKGSAFLREIALAFPQRPFIAIETWGPADPAISTLPNVRVVPRQWSLSRYYNSARVLLVPSVVDDAFPRVVTEAALHGVPSVGSDRGGIPEAVGAGGFILPLQLDLWVDALRRLDDNEAVEHLSRVALSQARRRVGSLVSHLEAARVI